MHYRDVIVCYGHVSFNLQYGMALSFKKKIHVHKLDVLNFAESTILEISYVHNVLLMHVISISNDQVTFSMTAVGI